MSSIMRHVTVADPISQFVGKVVVSRGPVTPQAFTTLLGIIADQVRTQYDFSERGSREAVLPHLRKLCPPTVQGPCTARRPLVFTEKVVEHPGAYRTYHLTTDGAE